MLNRGITSKLFKAEAAKMAGMFCYLNSLNVSIFLLFLCLSSFCLDSVSGVIGKVQIMYDFMTNSRFHLFHLMLYKMYENG